FRKEGISVSSAACKPSTAKRILSTRRFFSSQWKEISIKYRQRNLDAGPANGPLDSKIGRPLGFWGLRQFFRLLQRGFIELSDFLNLPKLLLRQIEKIAELYKTALKIGRAHV